MSFKSCAVARISSIVLVAVTIQHSVIDLTDSTVTEINRTEVTNSTVEGDVIFLNQTNVTSGDDEDDDMDASASSASSGSSRSVQSATGRSRSLMLLKSARRAFVRSLRVQDTAVGESAILIANSDLSFTGLNTIVFSQATISRSVISIENLSIGCLKDIEISDTSVGGSGIEIKNREMNEIEDLTIGNTDYDESLDVEILMKDV